MTLTVKHNTIVESKKSYGVKLVYQGNWETIWIPKKLCTFGEHYKLFENGTEEIIDFPDWVYKSEIKKIDNKNSDYYSRLKELGRDK